MTKAERLRRIDDLLTSFGMQGASNTIIGTPIRKGLSGGQKRRVGVASQLITCSKILFLDEPTSGLDSVASYEVIAYLKDVAKKNKVSQSNDSGTLGVYLRSLADFRIVDCYCKHPSTINIDLCSFRHFTLVVGGKDLLLWPNHQYRSPF